jgi:type II pantothenate kinase
VIKIFITYSIKLQDEPNLKNIPQNVIGIDIGQSLTKISYLYKNQLHLLIHPTQDDYDYINKYLIDNNLTDMKLNLTGGKAYYYQKQLSHSYKSTIFNEFEANVSGIDILFNLKKSKSLPEALITTIGTGSSMILKKESYEHIGGSALGGGFFMALIKLLYKITSYDEAIDLAEQGDRYKVDLKVADIYSPEDQRINAIFREFTAVSLGKINSRGKIENYNKEDLLNSLICMIGENLGTIAVEQAKNHNIKYLIFCGGFVSNNKPLKQVLTLICTINKKKAMFLNHSIFAGAIGALKL